MSEIWQYLRLGEVINLKCGYSLPARVREDGPYPVVSSAGITGTHNHYKVEPPGVVTGRCGTLGRVYYLDEPFWPQDTTLYVDDFKGNEPRYVAYLLEWLDLGSLNTSTAVPGVNRHHAHTLLVRIPDVATQARISAVIALLDNLIENNRRRIEILEEMARLLYQEWFVHFRFPGHEEIELVDSDLGPIPEGWKVRSFSDLVAEITKTVTPEEIAEGAPVVGLKHLPRRSTTLNMWESATQVGSRRKVFAKGDILFGKIRPYFHKVVDAPISGYSSANAIVFRPKEALFRSRALAIASSDAFVRVAVATSNGTTMPKANTATLMAYGIPHPTKDIEHAFSEIMEPVNVLRQTLSQQNRVLRKARDLLIPRLVSGELDVSELAFDREALEV